MSKDGTPENSTRRCGELIARLRTARGWSRARLITRLCHELDPDHPQHEALGEAWLARLETGRTVKLPRPTVEALCRALRCTPRERALLLLAADRSVLAEPSDRPTPEAELLNFVMDRLYVEARTTLAALLAQRQDSTDELVLFEVAADALQQVIAARRGGGPAPRPARAPARGAEPLGEDGTCQEDVPGGCALRLAGAPAVKALAQAPMARQSLDSPAL